MATSDSDGSTDEDAGFDSWPDLVRVLASGGGGPSLIFRGQGDLAWTLQTKLGRLVAGTPHSTWKDREDLVIGQFKSRAMLHLRDVPADNDILGWLSLMQHYGAPTRMLDWTESPFVACWFAYAEPGDADKALWVLSAATCRGTFGTKHPAGRDHLGVLRTTTMSQDGVETTTYDQENIDPVAEENWLIREMIRYGMTLPPGTATMPLPVLPLRPDLRMAGQKAVFTVDTTLTGISYPLTIPHMEFRQDATGSYRGYEVALPVLTRIRLPIAWRQQALESLRLMNISAETIFPGLDGLGRDVALSLTYDLALGVRDVFDWRLDPRRDQHSPDPEREEAAPPPPRDEAASRAV